MDKRFMDLLEYYDQMKDNEIIFAYKGSMNQDMMRLILKMTDSKMEELGEERNVRRKVFSILIECLQNMIHHVDKEGEEVPEQSDLVNSLLVVRRIENEYQIGTGNVVTKDAADFLRTHIDRINSMTPDELKTFYQEVLTNNMISDKGGAGLGIIDIARKSKENKLEYNFRPLEKERFFFSLYVQVGTTPTR